MKAKFLLIHSYDTDVECEVVPDRYCASRTAYFMRDGESLIELARTIREAEKETNEWIRSYGNVLKGLNYWKQRALNT